MTFHDSRSDRLRAGTAAVAALLAVTLSGCGGSDDGHGHALVLDPPASTTPLLTQTPTWSPPTPTWSQPSATASDTPTPKRTRDRKGHKPEPGPPPAPLPVPTVPAGTGRVRCPAPTTTVSDTDGLKAALRQAKPGEVIRLADGTYTDTFAATVSGTASQPIFLCGDAGAILDGDGIKGGYVFHLDGASYWRLVGFSVRNGQKGIVADHSQHSVIQGLTVTRIGDEGIHLRSFSDDNVVVGNSVSDTGLRRDKFGEGIYVGSAESNWCTYTDCKPDNSDHNVVRDNKISATKAESVDVKEGTTGGVLLDNTFDGSDLTGGDSWVDVKGDSWLIQGNVGHSSPQDGFQTHQIVDGWGTRNLFRANVADVGGPGYGFHVAPALDNKVSCDNTVDGAAKGLANVPCS